MRKSSCAAAERRRPAGKALSLGKALPPEGPLTMAEAPSFFASVYALVAQIPPGFVASYGQLARMLGAPRAARQVGWAMRRCPDELPWQRVIREDGTIAGGEYAPLRRAMLEAEGVPFTQDGRVAIDRCRWQPAEEG
mgnify:CR=1 FL=1